MCVRACACMSFLIHISYCHLYLSSHTSISSCERCAFIQFSSHWQGNSYSGWQERERERPCSNNVSRIPSCRVSYHRWNCYMIPILQIKYSHKNKIKSSKSALSCKRKARIKLAKHSDSRAELTKNAWLVTCVCMRACVCVWIFSPFQRSQLFQSVSSTQCMFALLQKVENQVIICGPMKILKPIWETERESSQMAKEIK